jgi:TrmH family RNA methyltransferase
MLKIPPPILIFVRPQAPGNIGALARVMSNFGCTQLRLVGDDPALTRDVNDPFNKMDWALAKKGESIRSGAKWYLDLAAACEGLHLVVGTSGREVEFDKGYARPHLPPHEAFQSVASFQHKIGETFAWALVMGPEDDGLSDHEAACCQKLIRIPTVDESPSINIAMAAGCVLYHWNLCNLGMAPLGQKRDSSSFLPVDRQGKISVGEASRADWSTVEQCEDFLDYVMALVEKTQFLKYPDQDAVRARIRRWVQATPIPLGELLFGFEILYHLKSWGTGKFEARDFLKRSSKKEK